MKYKFLTNCVFNFSFSQKISFNLFLEWQRFYQQRSAPRGDKNKYYIKQIFSLNQILRTRFVSSDVGSRRTLTWNYVTLFHFWFENISMLGERDVPPLPGRTPSLKSRGRGYGKKPFIKLYWKIFIIQPYLEKCTETGRTAVICTASARRGEIKCFGTLS